MTAGTIQGHLKSKIQAEATFVPCMISARLTLPLAMFQDRVALFSPPPFN